MRLVFGQQADEVTASQVLFTCPQDQPAATLEAFESAQAIPTKAMLGSFQLLGALQQAEAVVGQGAYT